MKPNVVLHLSLLDLIRDEGDAIQKQEEIVFYKPLSEQTCLYYFRSKSEYKDVIEQVSEIKASDKLVQILKDAERDKRIAFCRTKNFCEYNSSDEYRNLLPLMKLLKRNGFSMEPLSFFRSIKSCFGECVLRSRLLFGMKLVFQNDINSVLSLLRPEETEFLKPYLRDTSCYLRKNETKVRSNACQLA